VPLSNLDVAHKKTFTWGTLTYRVPGPNGQIRLLHDVFGYVKPGTLTALMGASGAGTFSPYHVIIGLVLLIIGRQDNLSRCPGAEEEHRCRHW
jgi:ABC-type multidrug transport system ATPase subunit